MSTPLAALLAQNDPVRNAQDFARREEDFARRLGEATRQRMLQEAQNQPNLLNQAIGGLTGAGLTLLSGGALAPAILSGLAGAAAAPRGVQNRPLASAVQGSSTSTGIGSITGGAQTVGDTLGAFAKPENLQKTGILGAGVVSGRAPEALAQIGQLEAEQNRDRFQFVKGLGIVDKQQGRVHQGVEQLGQPSLDPEVQFSQERNLAKDFQSITKDFRTVRDSYSKIQTASTDPSGAGDVSLIFSYMKMLDPNSVVRESEFATIENAGSVPQRVIGLYNKALEGKKLEANVRKDFVKRSNQLFRAEKRQFDKTSNQYRKLAKSYNLEPDRVVIDFNKPPTPIEEVDSATTQINDIVNVQGQNYIVVGFDQNGEPLLEAL